VILAFSAKVRHEILQPLCTWGRLFGSRIYLFIF
jgi:hypothetical protein